MNSQKPPLSRLHWLARGDPQALAAWLREPVSLPRMLRLAALIMAGTACYGLGLGLWRAPLQGFYVAMKMPLLIAFTLGVNGLINGMLGHLLGSGMTFKQTLLAIMLSFGIFSLIVGSMSPLIIAWVLDAPPAGSPEGTAWYRYFLLGNTFIIAFAGIVANHKLLRLIQVFASSREVGQRTLVAWLAGNLFVGAQLSYLMRPFFGNPDLPVQFFRSNAMEGNFYEAVWSMTLASIGPKWGVSSASALIGCLVILIAAMLYRDSTKQPPNA